MANSGNAGKTMVVGVGLFDFTTGCVVSANATILVGVQCACYFIVELVVFILYMFFSDQDTWGIKRETLILISIQLFFAVCYIPLGSIHVIKSLVDYFVSYGHLILVYSSLELYIDVLLPIVYAIVKDWKTKKSEDEENRSEMTELQQFLLDKKSFEVMLDYARRFVHCKLVTN